jgi:ubiquinone biosynthesis protein COQ9
MNQRTDWADEAEARLLNAALETAPRLGWSRRLVVQAARETGLSEAEADLLLPEGPRDLAALLARRHDTVALASLSSLDPTGLKVRERIRTGVLAWVSAAMDHTEATRRWLGFLALPVNTPLALRLAWASADALWRWAGDTATDENHYTKRALVAEILTTTLAIRLSGGDAAAEEHLDGRIAGVMAFERWKAGLKPSDLARRVAGALGRVRYGRAP